MTSLLIVISSQSLPLPFAESHWIINTQGILKVDMNWTLNIISMIGLTEPNEHSQHPLIEDVRSWLSPLKILKFFSF